MEFGEILKIIRINDEIYFHLKVLEESIFDDHYHAYVIEDTHKFKLLKYEDIKCICTALSVKTIMNTMQFYVTVYSTVRNITLRYY